MIEQMQGNKRNNQKGWNAERKDMTVRFIKQSEVKRWGSGTD